MKDIELLKRLKMNKISFVIISLIMECIYVIGGSLITGFSATLLLLFIEYMYFLDFKEQHNYILVLFLLLTSIQILFYILMATASLILQFKMNLIKLLETSLRPLIIKKGDYYYFYTKIKHDCNKDNPINNLKMFKDIKD